MEADVFPGIEPTRQASNRLGPRPLPLLLASEGWMLMRALATAESLRAGEGGVSLLPPGVRDQLHGTPPEVFATALETEARRRYGAFLEGVTAYRAAALPRTTPEPPVVWRSGNCRLLDYGEEAGGRPVVVVPSLVNRAYILDLTARRSLMRSLAQRGFRPLLLDWGWPDEEETRFDIAGYVAQRLEPALQAVVEQGGRAPVVLGYCMGGLFAMAAACRRPALVAGFIGLAVPWDFRAEPSPAVEALLAARAGVEAMVAGLGALPVDLVQAFFVALDPGAVARKYRVFAALPPDSPEAADFTVLEDWLNDGVPLAGPVAMECLTRWYGANAPAAREWVVGGVRVDPARYTGPALIVVPARDRIVPPASALALAAAMAQAETLSVPLGHVGMVAGRRAAEAVYEPVADWIERSNLP